MNEKKTAEIKNGTKMPIEDHQRILEDAHNYSDNMWRIEAYIAGGSKEYWRAAQETAALRDKLSALEMADNIMLKDLREQLNHEREENERLKLEKTELYWRSQFSFLQRDYDELEKKHGKENERLKEALKKLWIAADIILDPLDSEELSQPVYKGLWKEIRNAKKLTGQ